MLPPSHTDRSALAAIVLVAILTVEPHPVRAQAESDAIIDEIRAMLGALGGAGEVDPQALVESELPTVERLAGMKANAPIAVRMVSREEAVQHIANLIDAQLPPPKLALIEATYKALGFLPLDASLADEITALYGGQAGGFYDPVKKELVLLKDLPMMLQVPVVRHELVHALQDQNHDLSARIAEAQDDEDRAAALQAVLEGHAVDVMNRATLGSLGVISGETGGLSPGLAAELMETLGIENGDPAQAMEAATAMLDPGAGSSGGALAGLLPQGLPVLTTQLLFPYTTGTDFTAGYRATHPDDPACAALYRRIPRTTAEVLDPARWEAGTIVPDLVKSGTMVPGWKLRHETSLGRLLVWVLLTNQADPSAGDPAGGRWMPGDYDRDVVLGSGWRGDRVALFGAPDSVPGTFVPGSYAVVWTSRWRDNAEARAIDSALRSRHEQATVVLTGDRVSAIFAGPAALRTAMLDQLSLWE